MKHQTRQERRQSKRDFRQAMDRELREHRSSFVAFSILRLLVIVALVRQLMRGSFESAFFCALTYLLLYVPSWVQVKLRIELPPPLEITILCFIFAAEILGEVNAFYVVIPGWDTMLHTLNGFLSAAVGFSMTVGVLWEFFEFFMDLVFHTDMQKDTVIHAIYTVALDPTLSNTAVAVPDITEVTVNGRDLGLGGYLDIGLIDTMKDLFVNFIGATVFSTLGYFYARSKGRSQTAATRFVPSRKTVERDYLLQAEQRRKKET